MTAVLALSLSSEIEKYGAYAGIAAIVGLGVLALLYFAQARELKRLREWAGRAPERDAELQQRAVAEAQRRAAAPAPRPQPARPAGPATPAAVAAAAAKAPAAPAQPAAPGTQTGTPTGPRPPVPATAAAAAGAAAVTAAGKPAVTPPATPGQPGTPTGVPATTAPGAKPAGTPGATPAATPGAPKPAVAAAAATAPPSATPAAPAGTPAAPAGTPAAPAGTPAAPPPAVPPAPAPPTPAATPAPAPPAAPPARSRPRPAAAPVRATRQEGPVTPREGTRPPAQQGSRRGLLAVVLGGLAIIAVAFLLITQVFSGDDSTTPEKPNSVGTPTTPAASDGSGTAAKPQPKRETTQVAVFNGTRVTGLARAAADKLTAAGYKNVSPVRTDTTNQARASTVVYWQSGSRREGVDVAKLIGVSKAALQPMDQNARVLGGGAPVVVIVGSDQAQ